MVDFNSNNGFATSIWGPSLWHILRTISFNYPVHPSYEQKREYYNFLTALGHVLPCKACRTNYHSNLISAGFNYQIFASRDSFCRFIYKLEQCVHEMTKQETLPFSFNANRLLYESFRAKCATVKDKESGCVLPVNNIKSRSFITICPDKPGLSLNIDPQCVQTGGSTTKNRTTI